MLEQLFNDCPCDPAPAKGLQNMDVSDAAETFRRVIWIVANRRQTDQLIAFEGAQKDFSGPVVALGFVEPVIAQPKDEPPVCGSRFSNQCGELRLTIRQRTNFARHRISSARSNTRSNISRERRPVFVFWREQ